LSRAQEKRTLQEHLDLQQALPTVPLNAEKLEADFRRVMVQGEFDREHYWLLENQILNGSLGYHVVMPFLTGEGVLLVNRGWVAAGQYREQNPQFLTPNGPIQITGSLVTPSDSPMIAQVDTQVRQWPPRLLEIDVKLLSQQYGEPLIVKILQLDADNVAALDVAWQPINMSPQKHVGYAVQWFGMAMALMVLWLFANSNLGQILRKH